MCRTWHVVQGWAGPGVARDVQNLACGSGVGGSRSRDVQNLGVDQGWAGPGVAMDVQNRRVQE